MDARPYKVIFDTDPGVDDAMALYFALAHPDIEVIGITTTFGNVSVEQAEHRQPHNKPYKHRQELALIAQLR